MLGGGFVGEAVICYALRCKMQHVPRTSSVAHVLSFAFRRQFHMARQNRLYATKG
jgi:hypothetical protein